MTPDGFTGHVTISRIGAQDLDLWSLEFHARVKDLKSFLIVNVPTSVLRQILSAATFEQILDDGTAEVDLTVGEDIGILEQFQADMLVVDARFKNLSLAELYYALSKLTMMEREVVMLLTNPLRPRTVEEVAKICRTTVYHVKKWRTKASMEMWEALKSGDRWTTNLQRSKE